MRACWMLGCFLSLVGLLTGCGRATPSSATNVAMAPVPAVETAIEEAAVVPVRHEVVSDRPRVRVRMTWVQLEKQIPNKIAQPFSDELPDLFGAAAACRVMPTDKVSRVIDGLGAQGMARRLYPQTADVIEGQSVMWSTERHDVEEGIVTPTLKDDGAIQVSFVPPYKHGSTDEVSGSPVTEVLRENETLVVAEPAAVRGTSTAMKTPILSEVPWIGPKLFVSRNIRFHCVKALYLVSCEKVP